MSKNITLLAYVGDCYCEFGSVTSVDTGDHKYRTAPVTKCGLPPVATEADAA